MGKVKMEGAQEIRVAKSRKPLVHELRPCGNLGLSLLIYTMKSLKGPSRGFGAWFCWSQCELTCGSAATPGGPGRLFLLPARGVIQAGLTTFLPDLSGKCPLTSALCGEDCVCIQDINSLPKAKRIPPIFSLLYSACNFHYKTTALGR